MSKQPDRDREIGPIPTATVHSREGTAWGKFRPYLSIWAVAFFALLVAIGAFATEFAGRGPEIHVHFLDGYGIKTGDAVRHRGIDIGEVINVRLDRDFHGVDVAIRLAPHAAAIAQEGSRFWIQRPKLSLQSISGLDTVIGAKYIEALPGPTDSPRTQQFVGLESPLVMTGDADVQVTVRFADGHGLDVGSRIKHRGIDVGEVTSLAIDRELRGIVVGARLVRGGALFARGGTQFWIERPNVSLTSVRGLETIVGGPYLSVRPGPQDAEVCLEFEGLDVPPVILQRTDGLEFVLVGTERKSLESGAPISYRGLRIGQVLSVGLSHDARNVEARLFVDAPYTDLLRTNTKFWSYGGMGVSVGLTGISLNLDNLATVAAGGVALAIPDPPGDLIHTGHRFELLDEPPNNWFDWSPRIAVGSPLLDNKASLPRLQRAALTWRIKRLGIPRTHRRVGWLFPLDNGQWVIPSQLTTPPTGAVADSCMLEVSGARLPVPDDSTPNGKVTVSAMDVELDGTATWAVSEIRSSQVPEEIVLYTGPQDPQMIVPADRMQAVENAWLVEPSIPLDDQWNGAAAIASHDAHLIGMLVVDEGHAWVVPLAGLVNTQTEPQNGTRRSTR